MERTTVVVAAGRAAWEMTVGAAAWVMTAGAAGWARTAAGWATVLTTAGAGAACVRKVGVWTAWTSCWGRAEAAERHRATERTCTRLKY